jgi:hypothetical protein
MRLDRTGDVTVAHLQRGARVFPSKSAAKAEFRRILNSYPENQPLTGEDDVLVRLLLEDGYHPEADEKVGAGIASLTVRRTRHSTKCFWIHRVDGSVADFSYLVALDGAPSAEKTARAALRWEIEEQIASFRASQAPALAAGLVRCGLCGEVLPTTDLHVDHAEPTFDELASRFAAAVGGWEALPVECVGPTGRQLADRGNGEVWQVFHRQTARLRLTHQQCNLARRR